MGGFPHGFNRGLSQFHSPKIVSGTGYFIIKTSIQFPVISTYNPGVKCKNSFVSN